MKKLLAGTILFGSIWGLLECSLGDWLHGYGLSAIMASIAVFLMAVTRHIYRAPGMQAGMALIASLLRHFNPMGTCLVCASIAIFIEGLAFEIIWLLPWRKYQSYTMKVSMGVISFYSIYAIGYLSTQILTPLLTSKFYPSNLIGVIPKILAGATIAGIIGGFALPVAYLPVNIKIKDKFYYPITAVITLFCWIAVISGI
ncbi:MAG TPA: hypothetical protein ENI52_02760 [Thermoplasmata archaeon]|nr:hypothetical protein [Thermoplasmata archaeon]